MRKWALPVGIGVGVIALVVVALVREPVQLDPSEPEGAVQGYLQALSNGDNEAAFEYLDPESFAGCEPEASDFRFESPRDFEASLGNVTLRGEDRAEVKVTIREGGGGLMGGVWTHQEFFTLRFFDRNWYITGQAWPYYFFGCEEFAREGDF